MRRSIFSLAILCVPLGLAACVTEDDVDDDMAGETTGGDSASTNPTTTDGMTTDDSDSDSAGETDTEGDSEGEPEGCNVDSPYMGGWDIGCCQDEIVPTGWSPGAIGVGSVLPDWTMSDQNGDSVRVHDFCHDAIYFEYSAVW